MKIPAILEAGGGSDAAVEHLQRYYGLGAHSSTDFTGRHFDTWDSTRTRSASANMFTADDLVAVTFLSVDVPARAALELLDTASAEFTALLEELGPDRDLVDETEPWDVNWAGSRLWARLHKLPEVGPTTASKLFARKRPRLRPIYDSVVTEVLETSQLWEPLRQALQDDTALHDRLVSIRDEAGVSPAVPAIRVLDVVTWMIGKDGGVDRRRATSTRA